VLANSVGYASARVNATPPPTHPFLSRHEPPIDENVLDGLHRLSRDGKPDLAKTVIMLFLDTAPTTLWGSTRILAQLRAKAPRHQCRSLAINARARFSTAIVLSTLSPPRCRVGIGGTLPGTG
jgi:hypothetical protein